MLVQEEIICIQRTSVPPVFGISVEGISSRLRDIVYVCSCETAVLAAVAVRDYTGFFNIIQTESQIRGAGIVNIEIWIIVISPVI